MFNLKLQTMKMFTYKISIPNYETGFDYICNVSELELYELSKSLNVTILKTNKL